MRHLILFTLVLCVYLASSSPINHEHVLVNHPSVKDMFGARSKRSDHYAKGGIKTIRTDQPLELQLRKGEYICGGKVCKLQPRDISCPICQHPII